MAETASHSNDKRERKITFWPKEAIECLAGVINSGSLEGGSDGGGGSDGRQSAPSRLDVVHAMMRIVSTIRDTRWKGETVVGRSATQRTAESSEVFGSVRE